MYYYFESKGIVYSFNSSFEAVKKATSLGVILNNIKISNYETV
jgi:hypothetical protein